MGLTGDQLYVDFDLSDKNLPAGTRVQTGSEAVVEAPQSRIRAAKNSSADLVSMR
mgnify:FL=1